MHKFALILWFNFRSELQLMKYDSIEKKKLGRKEVDMILKKFYCSNRGMATNYKVQHKWSIWSFRLILSLFGEQMQYEPRRNDE